MKLINFDKNTGGCIFILRFHMHYSMNTYCITLYCLALATITLTKKRRQNQKS